MLRISLFIPLLFLFVQTQAQSNLNFGIYVGANVQQLSFNEFDETVYSSIEAELQPGFNLGIQTTWKIFDPLHLSLKPAISFEAFEATFTESQVPQRRKIEQVNILVPLQLEYHFSQKKHHPFLLMGWTNLFDLDQEDNDISLVKNTYSTGQVGMGFNFTTKHFRFYPELIYQASLGNIANPTFNSISNISNSGLLLRLNFSGL